MDQIYVEEHGCQTEESITAACVALIAPTRAFGEGTTTPLPNAYCTIRGVKIENALWTYCFNCHSKEATPDGPIYVVGLSEEKQGYLYARIPWHGNRRPKLNVPGTCICGRFIDKGISVETDGGEEHFCCNGHYLGWWHQQHPDESYKWEPKEWPEPPPTIQ